MHWQTSKRALDCTRPLIMGILNVTPDSFSDGGRFSDVDAAIKQAEKMIAEGADIIDIGGESTRPSESRQRISAEEEKQRVLPIIEAIAKAHDIPISIDTSKAEVAEAAMNTGAEIINDISGLRFDSEIANVAARTKAGLVLMHLRGTFETMHEKSIEGDITDEVSKGFRESIEKAIAAGVDRSNIALDIGIGFSKTHEQNLELIAKLDKLVSDFLEYPILVGASRKSFLGKILGGAQPEERLAGSLAVAALAIERGAKIIRVHDVGETLQAIKVAEAIRKNKNI